MSEELLELKKESFNNMMLLNDNEFSILIGKYNDLQSDVKSESELKNRYKAFNQTVEEYIKGKTINNNIEVGHEIIEDQYEEKSSTILAA